MPVRWRLASRRLMDVPAAISADMEAVFSRTSADVAGIVGAFLALDRQRLVIVGRPEDAPARGRPRSPCRSCWIRSSGRRIECRCCSPSASGRQNTPMWRRGWSMS